MSPPFAALEHYGFTMADMDHVEQLAHFRVLCSSKSAYHPALWSFLDEQDVRHKWWNPSNCHVLDVGAAYGSYSLPALANGCRVTAWSPPYNVPGIAFEAEVLRKSAQEQNGWRIDVRTDGLWERSGWLTAYDDRNSEWSEDCPLSGNVFPVRTIDSFGMAPGWIKIDSEGAELPILKGAAATLSKHRPRVLLENHLHLDPDCESKCYDLLR
jgi:FkbM family methyltransferase